MTLTVGEKPSLPFGKRMENLYAVDPATGCWNWLKTCTPNGYGLRHGNKKDVPSMTAHRFVFMSVRGPIPEGLELDHLCRNKKCVNPDHLEPVTHAENMRRCPSSLARLSSPLCSHGHPLDGIRARSKGGRYCKTCVKLNKRRQRERKKLAG